VSRGNINRGNINQGRRINTGDVNVNRDWDGGYTGCCYYGNPVARGVAWGACRLPNDAGLIFKVVGRECAQVKAKIREFWGLVRKEVTGADLPQPYLWR
jgi:hypothetical protein